MFSPGKGRVRRSLMAAYGFLMRGVEGQVLVTKVVTAPSCQSSRSMWTVLSDTVLILSDSMWSHIWTQWFLLVSFQPGIFSDSAILSDKELRCTASLLHHRGRCMEQSCLLLPCLSCRGEDMTILANSVPGQGARALLDGACHVTAPNSSECDLLSSASQA